jgi:hypothetical protein
MYLLEELSKHHGEVPIATTRNFSRNDGLALVQRDIENLWQFGGRRFGIDIDLQLQR